MQADAGERCAQLVRGVGGELELARHGLLQPVPEPPERGLQLGHLEDLRRRRGRQGVERPRGADAVPEVEERARYAAPDQTADQHGDHDADRGGEQEGPSEDAERLFALLPGRGHHQEQPAPEGTGHDEPGALRGAGRCAGSPDGRSREAGGDQDLPPPDLGAVPRGDALAQRLHGGRLRGGPLLGAFALDGLRQTRRQIQQGAMLVGLPEAARQQGRGGGPREGGDQRREHRAPQDPRRQRLGPHGVGPPGGTARA